MVKKKSNNLLPTEFANNVRNRIGLAVTSAFALVIGLVWLDVINSVVKEIIDYLGLVGTGFFIKFFAALLTTVIGVIGINYFSRWSEKKT